MDWYRQQANQRSFFEELGQKIGINTLDDWYEKLSINVLYNNGGQPLARLFNNSSVNALISAYPEHNWKLWKFNNVPRGFWDNIENQRRFFDSLGKELGVRNLDDWYSKLSAVAINKYGARGLLKYYKDSPITAIMAVYPNREWVPWKFNTAPRHFWKDVNNQRKYLDYLGKQIGVKQLDDWYDAYTPDLLAQNGGKALRNLYNGSAYALLKAAYPEHSWVPWKFSPRGFWDSADNVKQFLSELSEKLSIQTLDDWYRVDLTQLSRFGVGRLVVKYKGLYNLLKEQYPHHPWDPKRFNQAGKKGQRWLAVVLKKMFPNEDVLEDYMHPKAVFLSSNRPMQLDVFIPSRSLAFEYQGIQHYQEVGLFGPLRNYRQRDEEKRALCADNNIKLIEVPYWWNRTQESLQEMIQRGPSLE